MSQSKINASIEKFLNPKSIAVIGATEKAGYGKRFMQNIINSRYEGRIYPVNPKGGTVLGINCYHSISEVPESVDLAVIIVKAAFVEGIVEECAACGCGACLIITAGFSEVDKVEGKAVERRMKAIAERSGMRIIGPNTIGSANIKLDLWINSYGGIDTTKMHFGRAALISQSGAAGFGPILSSAMDRNVPFKYIITTGNEADLGICDFLEYLLEDDEVDAISVLMEGIKDGARFRSIVSRAKQLGKRLVLMKLGESSVGARAAMSHTASMTGDMVTFNTLVRQYGAVKAEDYNELVELSRLVRDPYQLKGKRLCVISHSGGISGFTGDQLGKYGFEVPQFSPATQKAIDVYLKGFGSPRNPLDLTGSMDREDLVHIMRTVEENEEIDGYVFSTDNTPQNIGWFLQTVEMLQKPCYLAWTASICDAAIEDVRKAGIPLSFSISSMTKMLARAYEAYQIFIDSTESAEEEKTDGEILLEKDSLPEEDGLLTESAAKRIAGRIGVSVPHGMELLGWEGDVERMVQKGKKYVLKIMSDSIMHKSDVGGVEVGLSTAEEIRGAMSRMRERTAPLANKIKGAYVEEMCDKGLDLVVGVNMDAQFGPMLLLGIGGIYTELFKLTACRILPVDDAQIDRLIDDVPMLSKLLSGYRGSPAYDRTALEKAIRNISQFISDHQERIGAFEINPLRVMPEGEGVVALDCVLSLR